MEFKPHLFKSRFTLEETQRLLKNNYKFEHSKKEIIKTLSRYPKTAEIFFYAEYDGKINRLILTGKKQKLAKMEFRINPDFDMLKAPLIFDNGIDKIFNLPKSFLSCNESEIIITAEQGQVFIEKFNGFLYIPDICFDDALFYLGSDDELILPEAEFYNPINKKYSLKDKEDEYNFLEVYSNFIFIRFTPAALGSIDLAKVQIFAHDFSYIANLFEYENEQRLKAEAENDSEAQEQITPQKPPKKEKTVKNKSNKLNQNRTLRNKKDYFTPLILASIHATAQAYPDLGGYQIINAIIDTLKEQKGFKKDDFYTPEGYLKKYKKAYNHSFPRNSGRHKPQISAIIIEQTD